GLPPCTCPSRKIFFATALIASGNALSLIASSMSGVSSSMAVFGRPLLTASSTFFHLAARDAASPKLAARRRAVPAAGAGARRRSGGERRDSGGERGERSTANVTVDVIPAGGAGGRYRGVTMGEPAPLRRLRFAATRCYFPNTSLKAACIVAQDFSSA